MAFVELALQHVEPGEVGRLQAVVDGVAAGGLGVERRGGVAPDQFAARRRDEQRRRDGAGAPARLLHREAERHRGDGHEEGHLNAGLGEVADPAGEYEAGHDEAQRNQDGRALAQPRGPGPDPLGRRGRAVRDVTVHAIAGAEGQRC